MSAHGAELDRIAWVEQGSPTRTTEACPDCGQAQEVEHRDSGAYLSDDERGLRQRRTRRVVSGACGCAEARRQAEEGRTEAYRAAARAQSDAEAPLRAARSAVQSALGLLGKSPSKATDEQVNACLTAIAAVGPLALPALEMLAQGDFSGPYARRILELIG